MSVDKSKQSLEAENVDMANEIKDLGNARQESERRRKQLEQQCQEYSIRLQDVDKNKNELSDKCSKMTVSDGRKFFFKKFKIH